MLACLIFLGVAVGSLGAPTGDTQQHIDLYMPEVKPKKPDTYLCHPMKMNNTPTYITGFIPTANMNIAHHMLLYGCTEPGAQKDVWNCGEMAATEDGGDFMMAPTCASGSKIIYAWAMDAPSLKLPQGVGFKVGGTPDTADIKYLVLQVHYKNVTSFLPPNNGNDSSGMKLITQKTKPDRRAGVYLMGTGGWIPPRSTEPTTTYMETACKFDEDFEIHPFAFRTHAHKLGKVVSGYRIRDGVWTEIGRMSPQKPQMFYNVTNPGMVVKSGDILAARCTMVNNLDHVVQIGSTQNDEMCNFYIMYFVNDDKVIEDDYCFSAGPPSYSWRNFHAGDIALRNIPNDASVAPGREEAEMGVKQEDPREMKQEEDLREMEELEQLEELYAKLAGEDQDDQGYYYPY